VELFAAEGYARTTLAKIAAAAGVSAETVQGQGPKADLLMASIDYAAFRVVGEENVFHLEAGRQLLAIDDPEEAVYAVVAAAIDVHEKTAPLVPALFGAANADPDLKRYMNELFASITLQFRRVLEAFRDRGWLRGDVQFDELVMTTAVLCGVETYLQTRREGWNVDEYRSWLRRMLAETVFVSPQSTSVRSRK
jgi:AcrR family transcriptional regulator